MTHKEALEAILEIAYHGHPDGQADRLHMIRRYASAALHPEEYHISRHTYDKMFAEGKLSDLEYKIRITALDMAWRKGDYADLHRR
jgi:hypothetical protein